MSRKKPLPDWIWDLIGEKLEVLIAYDYEVQRLTQYQYRINGVIDIYPVNKRWHDLRNQERGSYGELIQFVQSRLNPTK
jgi:hypothetical protein